MEHERVMSVETEEVEVQKRSGDRGERLKSHRRPTTDNKRYTPKAQTKEHQTDHFTPPSRRLQRLANGQHEASNGMHIQRICQPIFGIFMLILAKK
ncbi:hypothetical protein KBD61_01200 [Patescibacteria group bacterium]|nr:hypothetical protein [Patescibacteria group bacterium]